MLRSGRISPFIHGLVEYGVAIFLIAAPFLFGYDSNAARAVSVVTGVVVVVVTASSDLPTGLSATVPLSIHVVFDFVVAGFLIASPFLFNYSGEAAPTAVSIVLGVGHLLLTIATRFLPPRNQGKAQGQVV
jgi:hypothetical protein